MSRRKYNEYTQPEKERKPPARDEKLSRESTCSEEIYINTSSPEESAPGIPIVGRKKCQQPVSTTKTSSKPNKLPPRNATKQSNKLDTNVETESFYSPLDLSQTVEQDVYEDQLVTTSEEIKLEDKIKTEILPQEKETHPKPDLEKSDVERGHDKVRPSNKMVLYLKSNSKTIAAVICFFFLTFFASMFGSLIIGSVRKNNDVTLNNIETKLTYLINIVQNETKKNEMYNTTNLG